ncbi:MAG: acetyl-CoA carboxylase biotin carboxyl carrier protein [Ignavibacteriae bacterium]|nr:MAG: acetyl-CoA carboxylase biotin carboxyl carrier protein [Ignavibacteriota bacterium]
MKTDLNYIKKLIKMLDTCGISELEIEEEGTKIKLVKNKPVSGEIPQTIHFSQAPVPAPIVQAAEAPAVKPEEKTEPKLNSNLVEVRSPIVGTFYAAPSPNADSYVHVGSQVTVGTVLCIIEAMKLMNEIESEVSGKIAKIMVENGQPVEYNQVLFLVEQS